MLGGWHPCCGVGEWYIRLGYRYVSGEGGRTSSAWTVRSSHIGCSESTGQLLPGLPVNFLDLCRDKTCLCSAAAADAGSNAARLLPAVSSPLLFI